MTKKEQDKEGSIEWLKEIKAESLENMLKQPEIYPSFKPYKNTVYNIKSLSEPRKVVSNDKKFYVMDIERDGMKFSMNLNNSFLYQLAVLLKRNGLNSKDIINKDLLLSKDDNGFFSLQLA